MYIVIMNILAGKNILQHNLENITVNLLKSICFMFLIIVCQLVGIDYYTTCNKAVNIVSDVFKYFAPRLKEKNFVNKQNFFINMFMYEKKHNMVKQM